MQLSFNTQYYPKNYPKNMSGKLSYKITQKKDYIRKDGTSPLYCQIFLDGKRKRINLDIYIKPKMFDAEKQKVRGNSQLAKDYNLIIGNKKLSNL